MVDKMKYIRYMGPEHSTTDWLFLLQDVMRKEGKDVNVELLSPDDVSLVALQGPTAAAVLQSLTKLQLNRLPFMSSTLADIGMFLHS